MRNLFITNNYLFNIILFILLFEIFIDYIPKLNMMTCKLNLF